MAAGFSIDASVRIEGEDRPGVERLLRYCARPPFALERLYAPGGIVSLSSPESKLVYRLPKPAPDGRTDLLLSPIQLLERLARFVTPPRLHRHRYHGSLGRLRAQGHIEARICNDKGEWLYWLPEAAPSPGTRLNEPLVTPAAGGAV